MIQQTPRSELYFDYGDSRGEANFIAWHHQRHHTYDLIASGKGVSLPPVDLTGKVDDDWFLRHGRRHGTHRRLMGNASANNLTGLVSIRWNDRASQQGWLFQHALEHAALDQFYGL